jgi:hypothetical protein
MQSYTFKTAGFPVNDVPGGPPSTSYVKCDQYPWVFLAINEGQIDWGSFLCEKCQKWYALSRTTGNITKHLQAKHAHDLIVPVIPDVEPFKPPTEDEMLMLLLEENLPFTLVEKERFQRMTQTSYRREEMTIASHKYARLLQAVLIKKLQKQTRCVITFDEWSDCASMKYLGITVLSDGPDLGYQIFCIAHVPLESDQSKAAGLAAVVKSVLSKFGIACKTWYAVTDTTPVMPRTVSNLGLAWVPCFAHLFNLMLGDIISALKPDIQPLLSLVGPIAISNKWVALVKDEKCRRLPSYTPTRWYSMFKLIRNALQLKEKVDQFVRLHPGNNRFDGLTGLPSETWDVLTILFGILQTFRNAIGMLESNEYGTLSHVLEAHMMVTKSIAKAQTFKHERLESRNQVIDRITNAWVATQRTHWSAHLDRRLMSVPGDDGETQHSDSADVVKTVHGLLALAALLNPGVPLVALTPNERALAEDLVQAKVNSLRDPSADTDSQLTSREFDPRAGSPDVNSMTRGMSREDLYETREGWDEVADFLTINRGPLITQANFNVWKWWEGQAQMYKRVAPIAHEILLIPATSASSERSFSKAAREKTSERMSIKAENLEAMMALAGNLKLAAQLVVQELPASQ